MRSATISIAIATAALLASCSSDAAEEPVSMPGAAPATAEAVTPATSASHDQVVEKPSEPVVAKPSKIWNSTRHWRIDQPQQVVKGAGNYEGVDDISGEVDLRIDDTGVTVDVTVVDDRIRTGVDPRNLHMNDSVEVYLDLRNRRRRLSSSYEPGVLQFILLPGFGEQDDRHAFHHGQGGHRVEIVGTTSTSERLEAGYRVRIHFPLEAIERAHCRLDGSIAFSIGINDADEASMDTQLMLAGTEDNWNLAMGWQDVVIER